MSKDDRCSYCGRWMHFACHTEHDRVRCDFCCYRCETTVREQHLIPDPRMDFKTDCVVCDNCFVEMLI